jgi:hypothetical protein
VTAVEKVKTKLTDYLDYESPDRISLRSTLGHLTAQLPSTAIFGGMLREFALGGARHFASDIDLVTVARSHDIHLAIKDFSPKRNKFGGFRFTVGKWRFDIWAFEDTWAIREGLVKGSDLTDLFKTTFFNVDAALFHLTRNELTFSSEYKDGVLRRLLEINLAANPAPARMARRAIRLAVARDLAIGPALATFILLHADFCRIDGFYSTIIDDLSRHVSGGFRSPYIYRPQHSIEMR